MHSQLQKKQILVHEKDLSSKSPVPIPKTLMFFLEKCLIRLLTAH